MSVGPYNLCTLTHCLCHVMLNRHLTRRSECPAILHMGICGHGNGYWISAKCCLTDAEYSYHIASKRSLCLLTLYLIMLKLRQYCQAGLYSRQLQLRLLSIFIFSNTLPSPTDSKLPATAKSYFIFHQ